MAKLTTHMQHRMDMEIGHIPLGLDIGFSRACLTIQFKSWNTGELVEYRLSDFLNRLGITLADCEKAMWQ